MMKVIARREVELYLKRYSLAEISSVSSFSTATVSRSLLPITSIINFKYNDYRIIIKAIFH